MSCVLIDGIKGLQITPLPPTNNINGCVWLELVLMKALAFASILLIGDVMGRIKTSIKTSINKLIAAGNQDWE